METFLGCITHYFKNELQLWWEKNPKDWLIDCKLTVKIFFFFFLQDIDGNTEVWGYTYIHYLTNAYKWHCYVITKNHFPYEQTISVEMFYTVKMSLYILYCCLSVISADVASSLR